MIRFFIAVIIIQVGSNEPTWIGAEGVICPDCSKVRCTELEETECPKGTVLTENILFGCCPACVKFIEYGKPCPGAYYENGNPILKYGNYSSTNDNYYPNEFIRETVNLPCSKIQIFNHTTELIELPERVFSADWVKSARDQLKNIPVISSARCSPHLRCLDDEHDKHEFPVCFGPLGVSSISSDRIHFNQLPCTYRRADFSAFNEAQDCSVRYWQPDCKYNIGMFAAVQSKSDDSVFWCSSPTGEHLFGREDASATSPQINCKCSRKHWELKLSKTFIINESISARQDVSLHCEKNGNYEELQCDKQMCWCMNPTTGFPVSKILPETLLTLLPCYDRMFFQKKIDRQYLRKCESRTIGLQRTTKTLRLRGTAWSDVGEGLKCDLTGGFDKTYCLNSENVCYCVKNTGERSYAFSDTAQAPDSCNCARDFLDGLTSTSECDGYGNYKSLQTINGKEHCRDAIDGWRVSGEVPSVENKPGNLPCCLDSTNTTIFKPDFTPASPQEYWNTFNCRPFSSSWRTCDFDEVNCVQKLRDCKNGE